MIYNAPRCCLPSIDQGVEIIDHVVKLEMKSVIISDGNGTTK